MKLTVNSKELLALHNFLHKKCEHDHSDVGDDDVQLRQVYGRLRAIIIASLTNKAEDPVESWLKREQSKIDKLNEESRRYEPKNYTRQHATTAGDVPSPKKNNTFTEDVLDKSITTDLPEYTIDIPTFLTDNEDEVSTDLSGYPRRSKQHFQHGKHHKRKK